MILQSLVRYAEREKIADDPAFARAPVAWGIQVGPHGEFMNLDSLKREVQGKGKSNKLQPERLMIPKRSKRTVQDWAEFLVDKPEYVLGINEENPERGRRRLKLFADQVAKAAEETGDAGATHAASLLRDPEQVAKCTERLQQENWASNDLICFIYGSNYLHDAEPLKDYWREQFANQADSDTLVSCLLCGKQAVPARLHPNIKPLAGASTSGVPLVSFNNDAFLSYGWEQGDNASTCQGCAAKYTAALNRFLSNDPGRKQYDRLSDDLTAVYWSDDPSTEIESQVAMIQNDPETLHDLFAKPEQSAGLARMPLYFHCLLLQGAQGRATVRSYLTETIEHVKASISSWARESNVGQERPFTRWQLLSSLSVQGDSSRLPAAVSGELYLLILFGRRVPLSLLQAAVVRNRAMRDVSAPRAALLQVWASRKDQPDPKKERKLYVSLDPEQSSIGYQLGRLMALCEAVQDEKHRNHNRTITDRFYPSLSTRPGYALGPLMKLNQIHLSQLPKGKVISWKIKLQDVLDRIDPASLPPHLSLEEQARFALGYNHQRQQRFKKSGQAPPDEISEASTSQEQAEDNE